MPNQNSSYSVSLLHRLVGWVGAAYLYLFGKTSAISKADHPASLALMRLKKQAIYCFWHNSQVPLAYVHRGYDVGIMVSQSKDGEYIAQVMQHMGLRPVRGSSSRGGEKAFREMADVLEKGGQVAFSPDGPRGPVYSISPGIILAAQLTGAPIIPTAVYLRRKKVFRSWDRFMLPLPFGHIVVAHGKPVHLSPELSKDEAARVLKDAMDEAVETAYLVERSSPSLFSMMLASLMFGLYAVLTAILLPLIVAVLSFRFGVRRSLASFRERFGFRKIAPTSRPRLWLHAASVGEWQALRPLLKQFQERVDCDLFLTVSTPEAKRIVVQEQPSLTVRLLPIDVPMVAARWIRRLKPHALILVETELWPGILNSCHELNIPVCIVNGRLSEKSLTVWRWFKPLANRMMKQISMLLVRSDEDGRRFCALGAPSQRVLRVGNMKSDSLKVSEADDKARMKKEFFGAHSGIVLTGGSTWPGEEKSLLKILDNISAEKVRIVLAPRRPERFQDVERLLQTIPHTWSKWSKVKESREWLTDILLVDTLGDLKNLYVASDLAFIGGSLAGKGGQNPLEPAAAGLPMVFGPSMENFHEEAHDFKRAGAARAVRTEDDLLHELLQLVNDAGLRHTMGEAALAVVRARQGATERTLCALKEALGI